MSVTDRSTWTRERLETEAKERGVSGVEFLTRSELLTLLGEVVPQKNSAVAFARNLLRSFLERNFPAEAVPARNVASLDKDAGLVASAAHSERSEAEQADRHHANVAIQPHERFEVPPEEPIQTRTMARLLASQGHRERALKIYDRLLARHPEDDSLRDERQEFAEVGILSEDAQYATDHVDVARTHATSLFIRWELTQNGVRRAAAVCKGEPEIVVRVVTHEVDENAQIRRDVRDFSADGKVGERLVAEIGEDAVCVVAVGVGRGSHFVSIAHARAPLPASVEATSLFDAR